MDTDPIRVLLIEDDPDDVLLLKEALAQAGTLRIKLTHADRLSKGLKRVAEQEFDVILLDLNLPDSQGLETLSSLLQRASPIPIVVISGLADDLTAIEAVRQGAQDYLVKGEIGGAMLRRVLRYAIERKQAEQVLWESERKLKLIVENARDAIFTYDMQQRLIYVNPAVKELTGYGADELKEGNDINWLHPDDEARMMQLWDGLYKGQGFINQEFRIVTKSGQVKWCLGSWGALYDENGQQIGVQGSERDITERKRTEERLEEERILLRTLVDNLPDRVYVTDVQGRKTISNTADWQACGGKTMEDVIGKTDFDTYPPEMAEAYWAIEKTVIDSGEPIFNLEEPGRDSQGNPVRILSSKVALRDRHGKVVGLVGIGRDITERKRAEEVLRKSERELKEAQLLGRVGNWEYDIESQKITWSDQTYKLYERDPVLGPPTVEEEAAYYSPEQAQMLHEYARRAIEEGQHFEYDLQAILPSGKHVYFSARMQPVKDARDRIVKLFGTVQDITERKRAEEALQKSESSLQAILQSTADGILAIGRGNEVLYANEQFTEMWRIPQEVMASKDDSILLQHVLDQLIDPQNFLKKVQELYKSDEESFDMLDFKDGRVFERLSRPLMQEAELLGRVWSFRDVTKRKQAQQQIQMQIERLNTLWEIDQAITSSFDLSSTLNFLISEVTTSLRVDAVAISLLNPHLNTLEFAAGQGFHGRALAHSRAWLSEDYAGKAVQQRRTIAVPDLTQSARTFIRSELTGGEDFAAFFAVPLIAKGEVKGVLEIFHRTPLNPDEEWLNFLNTLANQAALAIDNAQLFEQMQRSNQELALAYDDTIEGWSRALDLRDKETKGHTQRVTKQTVHLARLMGLSEDALVQIRRGALLHDIGKMGVPDPILLKADSLTEEECKIMRQHPTFAYELLSPIRYLKTAAIDIPYCHHEKWDGTGYPRGLKGEQIPLAARIFTVVDFYDAVTSYRPYRPAWSKTKTLKHIRSQSGIHFDPKVVQVFLKELGNE